MSYTVIHGRLVKVQRDWRGKSLIPAVLSFNAERATKAKQKGTKDGNCNVTACQLPGATWWNTSTRCYY